MPVETGQYPNDNVRVFLDGVQQKLYLVADEELRFVTRYATDASGKVKHGAESLITETLYGVVIILLS